MNPKQAFQQNKPVVEAHTKMVESDLFTTCVAAAMLQMNSDLLSTNAMGDKALNNYARLEGARQFLQIFIGLGRSNEVEQPKGLPPNLNH